MGDKLCWGAIFCSMEISPHLCPSCLRIDTVTIVWAFINMVLCVVEIYMRYW